MTSLLLTSPQAGQVLLSSAWMVTMGVTEHRWTSSRPITPGNLEEVGNMVCYLV